MTVGTLVPAPLVENANDSSLPFEPRDPSARERLVPVDVEEVDESGGIVKAPAGVLVVGRELQSVAVLLEIGPGDRAREASVGVVEHQLECQGGHAVSARDHARAAVLRPKLVGTGVCP